QPPKAIAEAIARNESLLKKAGWQDLHKRLSSGPDRGRRDPHFAAAPLKDRALFTVQRVVENRYLQVRTAVAEVTREGELRLHPSVEHAGRLERMGDRLVGVDRPRNDARILDLATGKTLLTLPDVEHQKKRWGPALHFSREGLLVLNGPRLALHRPGSEKPTWEQTLSNWYSRNFQLADEGRLLATNSAHGTELALFVRMS